MVWTMTTQVYGKTADQWQDMRLTEIIDAARELGVDPLELVRIITATSDG